MGVSQRLKDYLKSKNISQSEFANAIDVSQGYVNAIRKSISHDKLLLIKEKFPDLNQQWLLHEIGDMLNKEVSAVPYDNYMVVEYADLSTSAGKLGVDNPAILPKMKKRLVPKEFDNGNYLVVGVDGDSMDDGSNISIPHGTEILIKEYHLHNGDTLPIRNNLFVIVSKTGTVFKQIIEHNTQEGYIVCHSYNPKYKDFTIHLSDVIQIFIYRKIVSFRPSIPEITN